MKLIIWRYINMGNYELNGTDSIKTRNSIIKDFKMSVQILVKDLIICIILLKK